MCKGEGKKGGFNNGKAIDFKNKFMVKKSKGGNCHVFQCFEYFLWSKVSIIFLITFTFRVRTCGHKSYTTTPTLIANKPTNIVIP